MQQATGDPHQTARAQQLFAERYGATATHLVWAPGRVNLIGEHTDYNDGFVLPMATEAGLAMAARPRADRQVRVWSDTLEGGCELSLTAPIDRSELHWSNYVRGVLALWQAGNPQLPGFDALIAGNLPPGGGLSSSAALEVATATLAESLAGVTLDPVAKALLCQRAEHEFSGVPCGIMDQFAVVFSQPGHVLLLDCRSRQRTLVPMAGRDVEILIINTMVKHELAGGEYALRRQQCRNAAEYLGVGSLRDVTAETVRAARGRLPEVEFHRALHVTTENERTVQAVAALEDGNWHELGRLMFASHQSLCQDYEVSCPELDAVVEIAAALGREAGVFGCRMTGGGFGGCAVALVRAAAADQIAAVMREQYDRRRGIVAKVLVSRPAGGAAVVQQP